ncbi:MAG TPA: twin-arginine translocase TatA/TatE family subunit [Balneolaceae bacterium]|nr:twin-arginine translocase TatA/TatE family subunit [Balneolaceae bacterium]
MGFLGGFEVIIIIILIIFLFGAKKIPELARGLGQGIKEFKQAKGAENEKEISKNKNDESEEENP